MPECAEVKRYVDQLNAEYGGQDLLSAEVVGGRFLTTDLMFAPTEFPLLNAKFHAKGKFIYWEFNENYNNEFHFNEKNYFFITLGMTGSFGKQNKHSGIKFTFSNGEVYYNDIRHFGTVLPNQSQEALDKKLKSLGWDPLAEPRIPSDLIVKMSRKPNKTIAEVLLDQKLFAGVGNYIRSEALYRAKLHPNRPIGTISKDNLIGLFSDIIDIVKEAYDCGGATLATYSDLYGNVGTFYDQFKVYGKKKDPLGNPVVKLTAGDGRTVHFVPEIQLL